MRKVMVAVLIFLTMACSVAHNKNSMIQSKFYKKNIIGSWAEGGDLVYTIATFSNCQGNKMVRNTVFHIQKKGGMIMGRIPGIKIVDEPTVYHVMSKTALERY